MSSLAEIEAAADSLTPTEKEELLRFLAIRLRKERPQTAPRIYSDGEIASMLAEDQGKNGPPTVDRLARLRKMYPQGPVKGDIQSVIDYDRGRS
jgi:hypothetical protein